MKYELRSYEIFSFGKCEGRASPLNYIERSGKAVRLPKHLRSKYFTYAKHIFHIHRKVNISHAAGVFHYHNLTAAPLNYDLCLLHKKLPGVRSDIRLVFLNFI